MKLTKKAVSEGYCSPGYRKQRGWALGLLQINALQEFSGCRAGRRNPGRAPTSKEGSESLGRPKFLGFTGQKAREERTAERTLVMCRGSLVSIRLNDNHVYGNKLPKPGERITHPGQRKQSPLRCSDRDRNSVFSYQLDWKSSWFMGNYVEYTKRSCCTSGNSKLQTDHRISPD